MFASFLTYYNSISIEQDLALALLAQERLEVDFGRQVSTFQTERVVLQCYDT
jgi:hypothetical protein